LFDALLGVYGGFPAEFVLGFSCVGDVAVADAAFAVFVRYVGVEGWTCREFGCKIGDF